MVCFLFVEVDAPAPSEREKEGCDGAEVWLPIGYEDRGVLGPGSFPGAVVDSGGVLREVRGEEEFSGA